MRDLPWGKKTFVRERGEYDKVREEVTAGTPAVLGMLPQGVRADRSGLATWLTSPEHPLFARVTVNRLWQELFGRGLVVTTENLGARGALPSHPELLDWLACEFRDSGWDVKHLHRLIVNSAIYKQSSRVTPELLAKDPYNRLLARGPRFRLDAEQVRDNALAVSGLLVRTLGGKAVRTYQPDNIWEPVA